MSAVDVLAVMDAATNHAVIDQMPEARAAVAELIAAAAYMAFAMRDGAVFERDYAAQRLATARALCEGPTPHEAASENRAAAAAMARAIHESRAEGGDA